MNTQISVDHFIFVDWKDNLYTTLIFNALDISLKHDAGYNNTHSVLEDF